MRDRGESLVELLVSLTIIGIAVVAVVGLFGASIGMSDIHRKQATAGTAVRGYAEAVQTMVADGGYTPCATTATYALPPGYTTPGGHSSSVVAVRYWTGTAWGTGCTTDLGLQRLTLRVASADGRAQEDLTLVVRKPCRPTDALCA